MPNWSTNHTVFIAKETTINTIAAAINSDEFDFNKLLPQPEVFDTYSAPVNVISDTEFAEKHNCTVPNTIDEFIAFYTANDHKQFHTIPASIHALILEAYGHDDWYNWRNANWGTKWTGSSVLANRPAPNLLIVDYDTAWCPPDELYAYLQEVHPDLRIINGSDVEGISDKIDTTHGCDIAFYAYYTAEYGATLDPYDFTTTMPDMDNPKGLDIYTNRHVTLNTHNISIMIHSGYFIDPDGYMLAREQVE